MRLGEFQCQREVVACSAAATPTRKPNRTSRRYYHASITTEPPPLLYSADNTSPYGASPQLLLHPSARCPPLVASDILDARTLLDGLRRLLKTETVDETSVGPPANHTQAKELTRAISQCR